MVRFMLPAAIILILTVTAVRLLAGVGVDHFSALTHFTPIAAIAFCAGVYLSRRMAMLVAVVPFVLSDIILSMHRELNAFDASFFVRLFTLVALVAVAGAIPGTRWARALLGTVAGSILFYVGANTVSWMGPDYAHTFAGWFQSQTIGVPGFTPAYWFLVKSLVCDLVFAGLFVAAMEATSVRKFDSAGDLAVARNS